jgi:hypothetical protein
MRPSTLWTYAKVSAPRWITVKRTPADDGVKEHYSPRNEFIALGNPFGLAYEV